MSDPVVKYYRVYPDQDAPADRPWGLYRRIWQDDVVVGEDSYHPRTGWSRTHYWMTTARGEPDKFLVEVDAVAAEQTRRAFQDKG